MPSFPLPVLFGAIALLVGALAGRWVQRHTRVEAGPDARAAGALHPERVTAKVRGTPTATSTLLDMVFAGVAAARLVFVVQWWANYREDLTSILRLGDGGYAWWAAVPAALAVGALSWRRRPALRQPLLVACAVTGLVFALLMGARAALTAPGQPLPAVTLRTLAGQETRLDTVFRGQPVVLNLWATWCPPCRREMPALARAQAAFPGVHFVFANQGESLAEVQPYLTQAGLPLKNVLLDGGSQLSAALTARALPTTAFYDAQGRLVEVHMGELTSAAIARQLQAMGVETKATPLADAALPSGGGP